jgi:hypothetical protein
MERGKESDPLVIDRAAAAERPALEAISEWARDKRVFVSSVMSELGPERQAASEAIRRIGGRSVMFEEFGGRDADPEDAYLGEVETSHIYLGILGRRYGKPLTSRFSATHTEYLHAEKCGLRIAVWALRTDDREGHEQASSTRSECSTLHQSSSRQRTSRGKSKSGSRRSRQKTSRRGANSAT